jgi:hypothetical protein
MGGGKVVEGHRLGTVDRVITALPWTVMDPAEQEAILREVVEVLADAGRTVRADFPPMMPYHCAAPIRPSER